LFANIYILFQKSPYGLVTFRPVKDDHFLKVSPDKLLMCNKVHADSVLLAMARDEGFPFCKFSTTHNILKRINKAYFSL
jgi:2-hydroxy-3-keto-5-methylthiopentenyl-1-phosphate phosphatase